MPNMCDGGFYDPIEGKPSIMESQYTYYFLSAPNTPLPDAKHKLVTDIRELYQPIQDEPYPQIAIDRRYISGSAFDSVVKHLRERGPCDLFSWSGGPLRAKLD